MSFIEKNLPHSLVGSKRIQKYDSAVNIIKSKLTYDGILSLMNSFDNVLECFYSAEQRRLLSSIQKPRIDANGVAPGSNKNLIRKSRDSKSNFNLKDSKAFDDISNKFDSNVIMKLNHSNSGHLYV